MWLEQGSVSSVAKSPTVSLFIKLLHFLHGFYNDGPVDHAIGVADVTCNAELITPSHCDVCAYQPQSFTSSIDVCWKPTATLIRDADAKILLDYRYKPYSQMPQSLSAGWEDTAHSTGYNNGELSTRSQYKHVTNVFVFHMRVLLMFCRLPPLHQSLLSTGSRNICLDLRPLCSSTQPSGSSAPLIIQQYCNQALELGNFFWQISQTHTITHFAVKIKQILGFFGEI